MYEYVWSSDERIRKPHPRESWLKTSMRVVFYAPENAVMECASFARECRQTHVSRQPKICAV